MGRDREEFPEGDGSQPQKQRMIGMGVLEAKRGDVVRKIL